MPQAVQNMLANWLRKRGLGFTSASFADFLSDLCGKKLLTAEIAENNRRGR